jgi:chromosome segregation ATPase
VAPRPVLSEDDDQIERDARSSLRSIDQRLRSLVDQRRTLIVEMRRLSAEQKELYDRRQAPSAEVERLYQEHGTLGKRIAELRPARDRARQAVEEAVVALRELRLSFAPGERERPEQIRREIAQLELRQQTHALPLDEENALIAQLRQRHKDLKAAEARTQVVAEHERLRKEAEARVVAARAAVERITLEGLELRKQRDAKMAEVRAKLVDAGEAVARLRAKGKERAAVMDRVDAISREMDALERDGRKLLGEVRARREEARRTVRAYSPGRRPPPTALESAAEANLQELLKRGKVSLGG